MDKQEIKSVWAAYLEVQEAKKKMDPVGQEDGDIDNDGDEDSSDEYLKNRRKKIGKAMKKDDEEEQKEGKIPPQFLKNVKKKKGEKDDKDDDDSDEKDVEEAKKVECPKCEGDGCNHCDDTGYHMKEDYRNFVESLDDEELDNYIDWLNEGNDAYYAHHDAVKATGTDKGDAYQKHHDAGMDKRGWKKEGGRWVRKEETELGELSTQKLANYRDKALKSQDHHDDRAVNAKPGSAERKHHDRKLKNRIRGADRADQKIFDRENPHESTNMGRYVEALRSIPNDRIDELSDKTKSNYAAAVKKQNASGETDRKAQKTVKQAYKVGAKADAADAKATVHANNYKLHQRKADSGGSNSDMHAKLADKSKAKAMKGIDKAKSHGSHLNNISARSQKLANRKAMGESAYDIIGDVLEMRSHARLADVLSGHELAAIEEKMKQPNDTGGKGEQFMSTNSAGEKKFYADHQKSNKDMTDKEEQGHDDVSKAGRVVKSQAPTRRGEKRSGDLAMPTPTKAKGQ